MIQSSPSLRVAISQISSEQRSADEALSLIDKICAQAKAGHADLVVFPEMALTGYNIGQKAVRALAETSDGPMVQTLKETARRNGIAVVFGFPQSHANRVFNACIFLDASGKTLAVCQKSQLFGDVDRAQFDAADQLCPIVVFKGWKLGLGICYDVEFPEFARSLSRAGADAILVPTANMHPYTSVATRIVPARAEENGVYLAYANRVGTEAEFEYFGLSCLIGPDGEDLVRAKDTPDLIFADMSKAHLENVRQATPYLKDLRLDLYS